MYPGAPHPAVDSLNLTVRSGALCMLLGTSGSGKTTLLRMVNRLIEPTSGEIRIEGRPTTEIDPIALRRSIGYVIQQVGLFPHLTVEDNVRVVPSILGRSRENTRTLVSDLLKLVGLDPTEYRNRYPRQLSGGQQQRVGLARALAADPSILLMDEPFGALDSITRERLQDELLHIHRTMHKTIVFVTHDVNEALKLGEQIVVMSEGKLLQEGSATELLTHPADSYVRQLLGGDSWLRRFSYLPVRELMEPASGQLDEYVASDATVLDALLRLLESRRSELGVRSDDTVIGRVSYGSISRLISDQEADRRNVGADGNAWSLSGDRTPTAGGA